MMMNYSNLVCGNVVATLKNYIHALCLMGARGWSFTKEHGHFALLSLLGPANFTVTLGTVPEMMIWLGKTDFGQIMNKV
jgi:hypothetical protein